MRTKKIIVLRWPSRAAAFVALGWRRRRVIESRPGGEEKLPETWLAEAAEIRVAVDRDVFFRPFSFEWLSGAELIETARNAAEPLLPAPLAEMEIAVWETGRARHQRHVMTAALAHERLEEIRKATAEWAAASATAGDRRAPAVAWLGPTLAALTAAAFASAVRDEGWAALHDGRRWLDAQSGPDAARAAEALARRQTPAADDWRPPAAEAVFLAVATASRGSFPVAAVQRETPGWRRLWPVWIFAIAALCVILALGVRWQAASGRRAEAEAAALAAFAEALPGTRAVSPYEQLRSRLGELRKRHDLLLERYAKERSALRLLALIEVNADPEKLRIDDLTITAADFKLNGSAVDNENVEKLKKGLAASLGREEAAAVDVELRRSSAGLGFDFTMEGRR